MVATRKRKRELEQQAEEQAEESGSKVGTDDNNEEGEEDMLADVDKMLELASASLKKKLESTEGLVRREDDGENKKKKRRLGNHLDAGLPRDLYLDSRTGAASKTHHAPALASEAVERALKKSVIQGDFERSTPADKKELKRLAKIKRAETAGKKWFDMPATEMTPEVQHELQMLRLRNYIDPKRHYKRVDKGSKLPKYFQIGTVVSAPADFYSDRTSKKMRKKGLVDELLQDTKFKKYAKKKYAEVQGKSQSGRGSRRGMAKIGGRK